MTVKYATDDFKIEFENGDKSVEVKVESGLVIGTFAYTKNDVWAFRPTSSYQFDSGALEQLWTIADHLETIEA